MRVTSGNISFITIATPAIHGLLANTSGTPYVLATRSLPVWVAWKVKDRSRLIGWDETTKRTHLPLIASNVRFLIPPWVSPTFCESWANPVENLPVNAKNALTVKNAFWLDQE